MARCTALLLLALAGCGEEQEKGKDTEAVFRAHFDNGSEDSFPEFAPAVTGTDPMTIWTCSKDPTPQIADDERTLCLLLTLDAAGLNAAGAPAALPIQGEAQLTDPGSRLTPPAFTGAAGHSPVVLAAWATVGCFSLEREGPLTQQVDGRLELKQNTADRLEAHVVLTASGDLSVTECRGATSADFDFTFDVARP